MIRLSRLADYAVVLMCKMSAVPGQVYSARMLSTDTNISEPAIMKILKLLAKAELIMSVRGPKGGYFIEKSPAKISVLGIVKAIDGPVAVTLCTHSPEAQCEFQPSCVAKCGWAKVNVAIQQTLGSFSIADFMPEVKMTPQTFKVIEETQ